MVQEKDPKRWDEVIIDSPFAKLTKKDVHEYYSTPAVQKKILDAVGDREAILRQSFTADKTVLRRKDEAGELIRLNKEQLDKWNAKRLSEVHPTFGRKTDVLLADIDPQEGVDWRHTKKITETVAKTMQSRPEVRDVSVRFSGGRGFYVEGKLDAPVGVDHARNLTKQILDGLAQRHDVYFQPVGPGKIRLDTTPLKFRGSIRSPYSINADTGLVSAPVKLEDLAGAQKKDFSVAKVLERMREKKAEHTLITGRPGSGKTTYLRELEKQTGLPSIHIDSVPERQTAWRQMIDAKQRMSAYLKQLENGTPSLEPNFSPEDFHTAQDRLVNIENRIMREALARKTPHLIEGWQLMDLDPKMLAPHRRILIDTGRQRSIDQLVARSLQRDPTIDPFQERLRAEELAGEAAAGVKRFRSIPGTEIKRPRKKEAMTSLPPALLDEVSKDKWATRAYGHKTLREIKEGKRDVVPIEDKGEVVGFMAPNETRFGHPSTGFVYVAQASRGKGLAAKVLAEYAKKNPSAISYLHRDNIASQKAHQKAGWEDTGAAARGNPRARVWRVKQAMEKLAAARTKIAVVPRNVKQYRRALDLVRKGKQYAYHGSSFPNIKSILESGEVRVSNKYPLPSTFWGYGAPADPWGKRNVLAVPTEHVLRYKEPPEIVKNFPEAIGGILPEAETTITPAPGFAKQFLRVPSTVPVPERSTLIAPKEKLRELRDLIKQRKLRTIPQEQFLDTTLPLEELAHAPWQVQKLSQDKLGSARKEFAPGIPANRKIHKIPKVKNPQPWTLAIQKHDADKAGTHFDLRLIPPKGNKAHSWAIPKAKLPKRGVMQLAIQQPTHTKEYATTFSGKIPKGTYGAGKVTMHTNEPVTVLSAGDNRVKFRRASGEQFTLFRTKEKQWGITKTAAEVIDEWRKKKREAKVTAFIRERMR